MPKARRTPLIAAASVSHGKLVFANERLWNAALTHWEGTRVTVTVEPEFETRRARASRYYWGVVLKLIAEHTGHSADDLHEIFRLQWNAKIISWTNTRTGEMEDKRIPQPTRKLSVHDFYEFVESVRLFAASELGVVTPDPDPEYFSKRRNR